MAEIRDDRGSTPLELQETRELKIISFIKPRVSAYITSHDVVGTRSHSHTRVIEGPVSACAKVLSKAPLTRKAEST